MLADQVLHPRAPNRRSQIRQCLLRKRPHARNLQIRGVQLPFETEGCSNIEIVKNVLLSSPARNLSDAEIRRSPMVHRPCAASMTRATQRSDGKLTAILVDVLKRFAVLSNDAFDHDMSISLYRKARDKYRLAEQLELALTSRRRSDCAIPSGVPTPSCNGAVHRLRSNLPSRKATSRRLRP